LNCPCESEKTYEKCCEPFIAGKSWPNTAEALMRSRYTAYTRGEISYISSTHHPKTRDSHDEDAAKEWAEEAKWLGLEIKSIVAGQKDDFKGLVEFVCHYEMSKQKLSHHEMGQFKKHEDKWYFFDGKQIQNPIRNESPKVGRNEPCPCGSGKKFKKCCMN